MYSLSYRLILLFSFILPLQIALNPSRGIDLASARILILFIFLIWIIEAIFAKKIILPTSGSALFLYSFLFLIIISLFWAENISWGLRKTIFLLSIFPLYLVSSAVLTTAARKKKMLFCLVSGATLTALIGLVQFLLQYVVGIANAYAWWGQHIAPIFLGRSFAQAVLENSSWLVNAGGKDFFRAISVFPDPHMLAFYLNMTLPFAIMLALKSTSKQRLFWTASSLLLFFSSILTFSRGGYLGLAVLIIIFTYLFLKQFPLRKQLFFGIIAIFFLIATFISSNPVTERFTSSFNPTEGSNSGRIQTWTEAIDVIKQNPFGVGIGNYAAIIKPSADYREPIYAHSAYLDIAAEAGLFTLLAWLGFIALLLLSFKKIRSDSFLYLAPLASIASFAVHSLVETPLFSVHIFALLMLIAALANYIEFSHSNA